MPQNSAWFHTDGRILSANKQKVVRYNPKPKDLYELIKLIPDHWKQKIENNTRNPKALRLKSNRTLNGKWVVAEASALRCKDFYNTIHFRKLVPMYEIQKILKMARE